MEDKEIKVDWDKVHALEPGLMTFMYILAFSGLAIVGSILIGIWYAPFPTFKCVLTFAIIFAINARVVRTSILDSEGEIKKKFRKEV